MSTEKTISDTPQIPMWEQVKKLKTSDVRQVIPKECYKRSPSKNFISFGLDLVVFIIGMTLIFASTHVVFRLLGGLITGIASAMMFVWAHDAAHGTLFKSSKVAEVLGTLFMLPSFNVYRIWSYGHNKIHHGFASFTPIDSIWSPLTPEAYQQLSRFQRFLYRLERNLFTCAFHYLRQIWWMATWRFNPGKNQEQRRYYQNGKILVLMYMLLAALVAYFFAGGIIGIISLVLIPLITFNYFIALIVYLHHTHPDIPFFALKKEWSHSVGALYCSTVIHCSKASRIFLHNIMIHIPHHLDIRIPFYHLPEAYQALKKEYGHYFHEYHFKWHHVFNIFKQCKLYDYDKKVWLTFKEAKLLGSSS